MKKLIMCVILLSFVFTMTVMAAVNPYNRIEVSPETELIDSEVNQGPNNHPIEYVGGYGIGYTYLDDIVVLRDLDFGPNGADQMTIAFGYDGNSDPSSSLLKIYIDDYNKPAVAEIRCTDTGGFDEANQKDFVFDCSVPSGVHTVYIKFAEAATGSIYSILFREAPPAPAEEVIAEAPVDIQTDVQAPVAISAPATGDIGIMSALFAVIGGACILTVISKKNIKAK